MRRWSFRQVSAQGEWQGASELLHLTTGEIIPVHMSAFLMPAQPGRPPALGAICRDLRPSRLIETQLRESRSLLSHAGKLGLASWNMEFSTPRQFTWSREMYRMDRYDWPPEQTVTVEEIFRRVPPEDHAVIHQATAHSRKEGKPFSFEHRIVRLDGEVRWIHQRGDFLRDEADRTIRIVAVPRI